MGKPKKLKQLKKVDPAGADFLQFFSVFWVSQMGRLPVWGVPHMGKPKKLKKVLPGLWAELAWLRAPLKIQKTEKTEKMGPAGPDFFQFFQFFGFAIWGGFP